MTAFADNKIKVTENLKYIMGRLKIIVGRGENAGNQQILCFPTMFEKASFLAHLSTTCSRGAFRVVQ